MLADVRSSWWVVLVSGILTVLLGAAMIAWPKFFLGLIVVVFALYTIATGLFAVVRSIAQRHSDRSWLLGILGGLLAVIVGLIILVWPQASLTALLLVLGVANVLVGGIQIVQGFRLRDRLPSLGLVVTAGALRVVVGLLFIIEPMVAGALFLMLLGILFLVTGLLETWLAFKVKNLPDDFELPAPEDF